MRPGVLSGLAVAVVTWALIGLLPTSARELCVVCSGPDTVYRCVAAEAKEITPPSPLACMSSIARARGHESCAIGRGTTACEGQEYVIGGERGAPEAPRTALKGEDWPAETRTPEMKPQGEPKTVKELAERAAESSGEQWRKAGDAVGKATRRTWDCVTSLFSAC